MNFEQLLLNPGVLKALHKLKFEQPTLIQEKTIPAILEGKRDIIALAKTGTGKTGAFGLPLVQSVDPQSRDVQALILCPTRELCLQIQQDLQNYAQFLQTRSVAVYGGVQQSAQVKALKDGVQIVVGTPGRTLDLIRQKKLKINNIQHLILDEADEMLSMGFVDDMEAIIRETPSEKKVYLFSATMPSEISRIAHKYMKDPLEISAGDMRQSNENVYHEFYSVRTRDRYEAIRRLIDAHPLIYAIVFCRTRNETKTVAEKLTQDGYQVDALHGELNQGQRDQVLQKFKNKRLKILVATDVAARGIDVTDISHVIHFNLPDDPEVYVHRSGRTGRAGKSGVSMAIVAQQDARKIPQIEKLVGRKLELCKIPDGPEICEKQLLGWAQKILDTESEAHHLDAAVEKVGLALTELSKEELINKILSSELDRLNKLYRYAKDINEKPGNKPELKSGKFTSLSINLGKNDGITIRKLLDLINERNRGKIDLGKIIVQNHFTQFEVQNSKVDMVHRNLSGSNFQGKSIQISAGRAQEGPQDGHRGGHRGGHQGAPPGKGARGKGRRFKH